MIPQANITAWRAVAPWADDAQVEQDLVLTRAVIELFSDPDLSQSFALRGGTALHKLMLDAPVSGMTKIRLALDIRDVMRDVPEGEVPDEELHEAFVENGALKDPKMAQLEHDVEQSVLGVITRSFRRALGVAADVAITGLKDDVRPYLEACDVLALCSVTEAFSLAAIEAMALRKPVVHSDVGGAAEMILPGKNGFLFPVGDTRALVQCLARLADPGACRLMGDRARGVVEVFFSEKAMVDKYERLLGELCAGAVGAHITAGDISIPK